MRGWAWFSVGRVSLVAVLDPSIPLDPSSLVAVLDLLVVAVLDLLVVAVLDLLVVAVLDLLWR